MKRLILAITAFLSLGIALAQLQDALPWTVQHFLGEWQEASRPGTDKYKEWAKSNPYRIAPPYMLKGVEMIDAFIDIESSDVIAKLKQEGAIVNCEFEGFITAQIPVDRLASICRLPGVVDVELSRMIELCTDTTLSVTHAGQVINGNDYELPKGYDGTGIIVGLIDMAFDFQHLAFRQAEDQSRTRIVRVYNSSDETGHPVKIGSNTLPGSVFMGEQIDTLTTDFKGNIHGTHTASIAAGTHYNGYGGMAPGADIVLCALKSLQYNAISETDISNCIKYIYSYADSVGKPCVISLSGGNKSGAHDGKDKIGKVVAQNTGPGHIYVNSAGNDGDLDLYTYGPATPDKPYSILIGNHYDNADDSYCYSYTWVDTWVRYCRLKPIMQYHILDKETGHIVWKSDYLTTSKTIDSSEFGDYFEPDDANAPSHIEGTHTINTNHMKYHMSITTRNMRCKSYYRDETGKVISRYQIGVSFYPPSVMSPNQADSCYFDSWVCTSTGCVTPYDQTVYLDNVTATGDTVTQAIYNYYAVPSPDASVHSFVINDSIISVGGYVARAGYTCMTGAPNITPPSWVGNYTSNSSYQRQGMGPTGKALPTVTAPSYNVVSALNRYYSHVHELSALAVMKIGDGHFWGVMSGTSVAAPTVAGIIAQWLQINPNLGPNDIKNIIAETAIKDEFTENEEYGFHFGPNGKIDAMAGAKFILNQMAGHHLSGDVDDDGIVSIHDVSLLIDYLLSLQTGSFNRANADLNQDGDITISDVTALIDILLAS